MTTSSKDSIKQRPPIAAIATAIGEAGISVIRVSGKGAIETVDKLFQGKDLTLQASHTAHFGRLMEKEGEQRKGVEPRLIDEVIITIYRSPRSYTGEDVVEISCHGGVLVTREVLEAVLRQGVHHAEPGEFTRRAFLNGKMELSQAEAVADIIHAKSRKALEAAGHQLQGALGKHIRKFRQQLIDAAVMVELELDFIEEDVAFANKSELEKLLREVSNEASRLIDTYESGRLLKHGVQTVFAGRPNAGKSTLLNTLMGKERAIVSETAGTTRDLIDADWSYGGLAFTLMDTAGLRETADHIESEGLKRTKSALVQADLILYLKDLTQEEDEEERRLLAQMERHASQKALLIVGTKRDLVEIPEDPPKYGCDLLISARDGSGMEALKERMMKEVLHREDIDTSRLVITSARHKDALEKAKKHIEDALKALNAGMSGDIFSIDLRAALNELGTITGEITTEDILSSLFSKFCIGK